MPKQAQIELFGRAAVQFTRPSAPCNPLKNVPLLLNIETLADGPVQLKGELSPEELDMETLDELVEANAPLDYDLTAERAGDNILLQGQITMRLQCECARCLRAFEHRVELPEWSCLLPLNGDEKIELINNSGDLTPYLREDTFLAFPQHPLCEPGCDGSPKLAWGESKPLKITEASGKTSEASVWSKLDNLNL